MMPANRGVGAGMFIASSIQQRGERESTSGDFGECLRRSKKPAVRRSDGEGALGVLPLLPAPVPPVPPPDGTAAGPRGVEEETGAAPRPPRPGPTPENAAGASYALGGGAAGERTPVPGAERVVAEPGLSSLPDAIVIRLAEAVNEAARQRRPVTVLELEPPGGGAVEIRLDLSTPQPSLRLTCLGWNGYLPLARDLPALQARLQQAGVVLQDISLVFERRSGGVAESVVPRARFDESAADGDEDESDAGASGPRARLRRDR